MWRRPTGLVVGWAAVFLATLAVGALLPDRGVPGFDRPVLLFVAHHRSGWLTSTMRAVTTALSPGYVLGAVAVAAVVLLLRRDLSGAIVVLLGALGADAAETLTKLIVRRPRPELSRVPHVSAHGLSYPSGHATIAAAGLGAIALVVAARVRGRRRRAGSAAVVTVAAAGAALVGFSRVYLGVHWPTDVLAGWLVAAAWLTVVARTGFLTRAVQ